MDIAAVGFAMGPKPGDTRWNAAADMDNDDSIDIVDVALVAFYFGTSG